MEQNKKKQLEFFRSYNENRRKQLTEYPVLG